MVLCLSKQEKRKIKTIRIHFTLPETTTLFVLQRFFLSCGNRKMNSCPHMQKKRHSCIEWNIIKGGNLYTYHHLLFRFGWKCVFFSSSFFIFSFTKIRTTWIKFNEFNPLIQILVIFTFFFSRSRLFTRLWIKTKNQNVLNKAHHK